MLNLPNIHGFACGLLCSTHAAFGAQPPAELRTGAWKATCHVDEINDKGVCEFTFDRALNHAGPAQVALHVTEDDRPALSFSSPQYMNVPSATVRVDKNDAQETGVCETNLCRLPPEDAAELFAEMAAGKQLLIRIGNSFARSDVACLPLKGFARAVQDAERQLGPPTRIVGGMVHRGNKPEARIREIRSANESAISKLFHQLPVHLAFTLPIRRRRRHFRYYEHIAGGMARLSDRSRRT